MARRKVTTGKINSGYEKKCSKIISECGGRLVFCCADSMAGSSYCAKHRALILRKHEGAHV